MKFKYGNREYIKGGAYDEEGLMRRLHQSTRGNQKRQRKKKKPELERKKKKQAEREQKQAEREQVKRIFNLPVDKRTPEEKKLLADQPLSTIEKTPTQRLETGYRQLTPKQTTELLVILRKVSKENATFLSFETKDTTSRALKYLLSAIHH